MKIKLLLFWIFILAQYSLGQITDYSVKYGIQGHLLIPNTEFDNSSYRLSLLGRGFLKFELSSEFEIEIGAGIGILAGDDEIKEKWETNLIPIDLRLLFSPFTSEYYSPYVYTGIGLLRWNVVKLPNGEQDKKSGWDPFVPIGFGLEIRLNSELILDISGDYTFTNTDELNNYANGLARDGYYNFGVGFTFAIGGGLTDYDKDGLTRNFEEEIGTNPNLMDSDKDGLSDGEELLRFQTNPLENDTDKDGINDGDEIRLYNTDPKAIDTDGDGLSDYEEIINYLTNPNSKDSDGDNLSDGNELDRYKTNPNKTDTDEDGIPDGEEIINLKSNPLDINDPNPHIKKKKDDKIISTKNDIANNEVIDQLSLTEPTILRGVNFVLESAELTNAAEENLLTTLNTLQNNLELKIEIRGYTDNTGNEYSNLALSEKRAQVVREWFVKKGIDFRRMVAKGFGSTNPIGDNNTELGREKNRRIEILKID